MATSTNSVVKLQQTETEVAILNVQVKHINEKIDDLKTEIKEVKGSVKDTKETLNGSIKELSVKISSLEKWRWMLMGAGIVLGASGSHLISKLLS